MKQKRQELLTKEAQADDLDFESIENKKKILRVLKRLPAAYLSEIAWEAGLTEYQTRLLLNVMFHDGWIIEEPVSYEGNPKLVMRVPEMSAKGQGGFPAFSKKRWYSLSTQGRRQI